MSQKAVLKKAKEEYKKRKLLTDLSNEEYLEYIKHINKIDKKVLTPIINFIWFCMIMFNVYIIFLSYKIYT